MLSTDAKLPIEKGNYSIMNRFLSLTGVLVCAALTVAVGSNTPAPAPQHGEAKIHELIGETEGSDPPTANKLQDLAHSVDKNLWQLRAHVQKPSSRRGELPWFRYQGADPSNH